MITPSLIYKFPLKYWSNKPVPCLFLFLHAVSADIVVLKNSIDNVALSRIDNFPQHLNAVHVFIFFSQTLTQYRSQIHMGQLHRKIPNLLTHFTAQSYYNPSPLPAPRSNPCRARSALYTRYTLYIVRTYIYIIIYMSRKQRFLRSTAQYGTGDIFLMRSYLHHPDIDGHLLRRYNLMR